MVESKDTKRPWGGSGSLGWRVVLQGYLTRKKTYPPGRFGWSVLHFAAFKGFARVCRKLVRLGADINAVNRDGAPPSHSEKD